MAVGKNYNGAVIPLVPQVWLAALIGGMVNGVIWWVLGALILMPLGLGMTQMVFVIEQTQWLSLMGTSDLRHHYGARVCPSQQKVLVIIKTGAEQCKPGVFCVCPSPKEHPVNQSYDLIFVYNADSGLVAMLGDITHRIVSPQTYPCKLCALTYSVNGMSRDWKNFVGALGRRVIFLHRDELQKLYGIAEVPPPGCI